MTKGWGNLEVVDRRDEVRLAAHPVVGTVDAIRTREEVQIRFAFATLGVEDLERMARRGAACFESDSARRDRAAQPQSYEEVV